MEFYTVKEDEIELSNSITHQDILFIRDGQAGYIWRGDKAIYLDEEAAKKIERIIHQRFEGINFELISDLELKESDNPKLIQIKNEIIKRLPSSISKLKEKPASIFSKIKNSFEEFKNYDNSRIWRKKLSNLTNLWKLSIFNVAIITVSLILMIFHSILDMINNNFYLLISSILLIAIFSINTIFVIFPMKFPLKIINFYGGTSQFVKKKEAPQGKVRPSKPKTPVIKDVTKKKPLKQIEIGPLKPIKKQDLKLKTKQQKSDLQGMEYLSDEDIALNIPTIPDAPKKKQKITIKSSGLATEILDKIKALENSKTEVVLVNCERCKAIIPIPIPKEAVLSSKLPVVPISYVHKNPKNKDEHCITIHLDHDFDIRRERISEVIVS